MRAFLGACPRRPPTRASMPRIAAHPILDCHARAVTTPARRCCTRVAFYEALLCNFTRPCSGELTLATPHHASPCFASRSRFVPQSASEKFDKGTPTSLAPSRAAL